MMKWIFKNKSKYVALCLLLWLSSGFVCHALKMSNTKISKQGEQLYFNVRMFANDVSSGMSLHVKKAFPLETETLSQEQKDALIKYLSENLRIKINSEPTALKCNDVRVDFANADEPIVIIEGWVTGQFKVAQISEMSVKNTLLFDFAAEQKNIVNISKIKEEDKSLVFYNGTDMNYLNVKF
ncbi:MAG: hypothetical protein J7604_02565 [Sporocytophaga sp.]|uniref:DUF6702 family protein n=1 Tax=Sporocytophaga sp. TaxID=2231183 RepID=UPI001B2C9E90|nr:DUF6702 family protein [Sporocytophaga sp.]MBO9699061.1 hypothetical protein [Sporocytophaga sp.]